jgi:hypothetical protein
MYRLGDGMGEHRDGFIKSVQKLYRENKDIYPDVKRPTTLKACIEFATLMKIKVWSKEDGWHYAVINDI